MFARLERELRNQGKVSLADAIRSLHDLNGEDIPFEEKKQTVIRFSEEQRKVLEHKGYLIYGLTGQTIASLRDAGNPFFSAWHKGEAFEQQESMRTDVAFNPGRLFLQMSANKTLAEQLEMVNKFTNKYWLRTRELTYVLGNAADYAELAFSHLAATGKWLFGSDYDFDYTRTTTLTSIDRTEMAVVGDFSNRDGLFIGHWDRDDHFGRLKVAPLIIPKSALTER